MSDQAIFYWDLSERDRAQLSREDVERYVDAELMSKGVLKARPPMLDPEPDMAVSSELRYQIKGAGSDWHSPKLLFKTPEAAAAFLKLDVEWLQTFYHDGINFEHGEPFERDIRQVHVLPAVVWHEHRPKLESIATVKAANKKAAAEYTEACKRQREALDGLWDDWSKRRDQDRKMRHVVETFEEYKRVAGGDEATALRFLRKVHSSTEIEKAAEWCGVELPNIDDAVEAPTPAQESEATAMAVF